MPDRDQDERGHARNGPGQPHHEEILDQARLESRRRVMEEAAALARAHYEIEPGLRAIYRLEGPDPDDLRIKLLEVNEQTVATGIVPVGFPPHPASDLHFASVVIEVTPQEYEALQSKQLNLPDGWEVRDVYQRPAGADHVGGTP
jgi:hypothetical protein